MPWSSPMNISPLSALAPGVGWIVAARVVADPDSRLFQRRGFPDDLGEPPLLVGRQGVHRIEDDRLDPPLPRAAHPQAVVENRKQKALGLARPGARGDDRVLGLPAAAVQPPPGSTLVLVGMKRHGELKRRGFRLVRRTERPAEQHPRPLEQSGLGVFQEPLKGLLDGLVPEIKRRLQIIQDLLADVLGQMGGEHWCARFACDATYPRST